MAVKYTAKPALEGKRFGSGVFAPSGEFHPDEWAQLKTWGQLLHWIEIELLTVIVDDADPVAIAPADQAPKTTKKTEPKGQTPGDLVCVNNGSEDDLEAVNGIGPKILKRIIQFRPYSSLEDLINPDYTTDSKPVMTAHQLDQVRDQIKCDEWVDPDADAAALAETDPVEDDPEKLEEV